MTQQTWMAFPATYRAEEVEEILYWVKLGESGVVIGGSGSGKSNVAVFLANRADVTAMRLPKPIEHYYFFHLDVNGLPGETTANFYRALLNTMYMATEADPELHQSIERQLDRLPSHEDSFGLYLALQRAHDAVIRKAGKQVVWLIDRFDSACQLLEATTLNTLRSLRDQFKDQLSYIAFTREPLDRLRNPAEFDEFFELMTMHTCWVRMMTERDARWVAQQVSRRYATQLDEASIERIGQLCGGLPAFLRAAYSALARGELPATQKEEVWVNTLLTLNEMKRNCREMWQACDEEEQDTLLAVANRTSQADLDATVVEYLENLGWLKKEEPNPRLMIFSKLFAEYIRQQKQKIGLLSLQGSQIWVDGVALAFDFPASLHQLLVYLLKSQPRTCSYNELIKAIWPHDVVDDAYMRSMQMENLTQLVTRTRRTLREKVNESHNYIKAVRNQGYRFVQAGQG